MGFIVSPALAAYGLDWALGDPRVSWHPTRLMGKLIAWYEARALRLAKPAAQKLAGIVLALGLPAACALSAWALVQWAEQWDLRLGFAVSALLSYFALAGRDMIRHGQDLLEALGQADLALARRRLARIVGRDVQHLDEQGVSAAGIESVAESFCDGLLAPLFWAFVGGAPAALAYRAVNTLDSMLGHREEPYTHLGWASAKLDDLANWLPARLSVFCVMFAAPALGAVSLRAWQGAKAAAPEHPSPNAPWPEGAFAGALDVKLGGPVSYGGVVKRRAHFGGESEANPAHLDRALKLFAVAGLWAAVLMQAASWGFEKWMKG